MNKNKYHNEYTVEVHLAKKEVQYLSPQMYKGTKFQITLLPNSMEIITEDLIKYQYDKTDVKRLAIKTRKVKE